MNTGLDETFRQELRRLLAWRHDALPKGRSCLYPALNGLPRVDWKSVGVTDYQQPWPVTLARSKEEWLPLDPLPKADVVVMTWTMAEWAALDHVFCDYKHDMSVDDVHKRDWRDPWYDYSRNYYTIYQYMETVKQSGQGGAPSLSQQAWGQFRMVEVAGQQVLLIKSGMHLAQDGTALPLRQFVEQICHETEPDLLLSIGTAGGVRTEDALGSALITNQARFLLLDHFQNADFNGKQYESSWKASQDWIPAAQKLVLPVPGHEVLPISPQYPAGACIQPDPPQSRIVVVDSPIITTDTFLFGTTENGLETVGCIVEMDDAVIAMVCGDKTRFGFVRNVSDPVINGELPESVQEAWAAYIYQQCGLYSSYNGALATWAVIAGRG
jgi:nucleoside phosphorylase